MVDGCLILASQEGPAAAVPLLVLLATAAVIATILGRFKLEAIPGYLIAGALVGPHVLGLVSEAESPKQLVPLAVILLMFGIGLHLDVNSIRRGMIHILSVGVISTVLFSGLGWTVLCLLGVSPPAALVLAMSLAMSSTAVLVRTLVARREVRATYGRVTLGVAIVQDLLTVVVMAALPPIAQWAGNGFPVSPVEGGPPEDMQGWVGLVVKSAIAVGTVAAILVMGRLVLPRVLHEVSKVGSGELVLVVSAAIALAAAIGTSLVGLSPEMGAFLAGLLLALTPFRYQLSGQIAPMRDLLMAIFFTAVGLNFNPSLLIADWWIIGLSLIAVIAVKALLIAVTAWFAGMSGPSALISGVYLGNAGEFTLIVLGVAFTLGIVTEREHGDAIATVIASLIISPLLAGPVHTWAAKLGAIPPSPLAKSAALKDRKPPAPVEPSEPAPGEGGGGGEGEAGGGEAAKPDVARPRHVIIAGFGPVGRALADRFHVLGVPYTVIELNARTVQKQAVLGRDVVYGDATNPEVLESAGLEHADAVLLTIPDDEATLRACRAIRALAPDVFIAARTNFLSGKFVAHQLGADVVTVEEVATALAMERDVLAHLNKWKRTQYSVASQAEHA